MSKIIITSMGTDDKLCSFVVSVDDGGKHIAAGRAETAFIKWLREQIGGKEYPEQ